MYVEGGRALLMYYGYVAANEKSRPGISTVAIGGSTGGLSILILIAVVATVIICVRRKR